MTKKNEGPARAPTIMDVAEAAAVSKSTVSLVLQGSTLIRDETAQRVRAEAQRLGYVYNRRAAELRRKSSNTIGVVINDLMNPFFAEVLVGIERCLVDAGHVVFMAHTHDNFERQQRVLQSMREHNAAGIVLCPAIGTPKTLPKEIQQWGIPLVIMVRSLGSGTYDFVGSQNAKGLATATRHLIERGHRRIAFLGGQSGVVYEERLEGYRQALTQARIAFDERLVVPESPTRAGGHAAMAALLERRTGATAAVCYNDISALGALAALGERGLRAGTDFALMGFDNVLDAAHSNPPLSTMDIHPGELGEQAAALLMKRMANPHLKRQTYLAEPELRLRQSG
ncbi:LacI family DNA-binding transcriptional regulator [Aquabacterium sp.]|uniref:LacI family DNA-binding transcriptional regulator n=1 Tax=Aquabacterium sp. TaxID=1872578 RepID=UPI003784054B